MNERLSPPTLRGRIGISRIHRDIYGLLILTIYTGKSVRNKKDTDPPSTLIHIQKTTSAYQQSSRQLLKGSDDILVSPLTTFVEDRQTQCFSNTLIHTYWMCFIRITQGGWAAHTVYRCVYSL